MISLYPQTKKKIRLYSDSGGVYFTDQQGNKLDTAQVLLTSPEIGGTGGTSLSTPQLSNTPATTLLDVAAGFQKAIGADVPGGVAKRVRGVAEKTLQSGINLVAKPVGTLSKSLAGVSLVGGFFDDIQGNIAKYVTGEPNKTITDVGNEFKASTPNIGFFQDMDPTAAGLVLTLFDAYIGADIARIGKEAVVLGLRDVAGQLPKTLLYKIKTSRIPVSDLRDVFIGTGTETNEALSFVQSLSSEEKAILARTIQNTKNAGTYLMESTAGRTKIGEFARVPETTKPKIRLYGGELPGTAIVGKPQPRFGLSIQPVRKVGGVPEVPKKYEVGGKQFDNVKGAVEYQNELENRNKRYMFEPEKRVDTTIREVKQEVQEFPDNVISDPLLSESRQYKSADEFVKAQPTVYHGSPIPLKSFSNKKGGVFFTEEYADATGFASSPDNIYEGYLSFKKPLEIDAMGAKWDNLNTKYGKSTQEIINNAQKEGYDGVIFRNIVDNIMDTAEIGGESTIYYAYKPKTAFLNKSQLTDIWEKAHGGEKTTQNISEEITPDTASRLKNEIDLIETALEEHPGKQLQKYGKGNYLPEITGGEGKGIFAKIGDDILDEMGFASETDAQKAFEDYKKTQRTLLELKDELRSTKLEGKIDRVQKKIDEINAQLAGGEEYYVKRDAQEVQEIQKTAVQEFKKKQRDNKFLSEIRKEIRTGISEGLKESETETKEFIDSIETGVLKGIQKEKNLIRKSIGFQRHTKNLSGSVLARLKEVAGVNEWKNATVDQLQFILNETRKMQANDTFLTEKQIEGLDRYLRTFDKNKRLITKREMQERFAIQDEIMDGFVTKRISNWAFPSVDIKESNELIRTVVDETDYELRMATRRSELVQKGLDDLLYKAEKAYKKQKGFLFAKTKVGERVFSALGGESTSLLPEEQAVVAYLQDYFVEARKKLGLTKWRKNYVTHIQATVWERFKQDVVDNKVSIAGFINSFKTKNGDLPADILLALDNIIGSQKFFKFALERKGGLTPSMNIRRILSQYADLAEQKVALDKVLPLGQAVTQILLQPKTAKWLKEFLQNAKGRSPDFKFKTGKFKWLAKTSDKLIDLGYIRLLGLNYKSAIKNIVGGESNSFVYQTFGKYLLGKKRFLLNPKISVKRILESGILDGNYVDLVRAGFIPKSKRIVDLALYGGMEVGEWEMRGSMFLGELTHDEFITGNISKERVREILDQIAITQGLYTKVDSPLFVQTVMGRSVAQFGRWKVTNSLLVRRIIKGAKKEWKQKEFYGKNTRRLLKMALVYMMFSYLAYQAGRAGNKNAEKIYQAGTELVNIVFNFPQEVYDSITKNPLTQTIGDVLFTMYTLLSQTGVVQGPQRIQFQRGIEDTYIAGLANFGLKLNPDKTIQDLKKEVLQDIESGKLTTEAAKTKFVRESSDIRSNEKKLRFDMQPDEYKKELSDLLAKKEITVADAKKEFTEYAKQHAESFDSPNEGSFLDKIVLYAKSIGTDPVTAFKFMFTGENIKRIDNGAIIVERVPFEKTQSIKKELSGGSTTNLILDHTIPLELGGSNSKSNLKLVSEDEWNSYTPVENYLGNRLRKGLISKKEAQEFITGLKNGTIKKEDILK